MFLDKFLPAMHVPSIYAIDLEQLKKRGIKGIITDLDNTLVEWDRKEPTPELAEWFQKLKDEGFQAIVVSNSNAKRVRPFTAPLGVPSIPKARKPVGRAFREALQIMGLTAGETAVIGDQLLTDVLGGNRAGLYTILVTPVSDKDGIFTRFNRFLERRILGWMRKKGMLPWEEYER